MGKADTLTESETEEEMEIFQKLFDVVRLLNGEDLEKMKKDPEKGIIFEDLCRCYSFWKKEKACENCTSLRAYCEKSQKTKLEILEEDIFLVISRYIEIAGRPHVMELIRKMDEDTFLDTQGYGKLLHKIEDYTDKLYKDELTGAYNRRYFNEEVSNVKGSVGVAMIDLDDFKLYNDIYGHKMGDMVLVEVVKVIRRCIRRTDTLVRYGGDEFLLILPGVDDYILEKKLHIIQERIREIKLSEAGNLQISVSIGGVVSGEYSISDTIMKADHLMYQAKDGKNSIVVSRMGEEKTIEQDDEDFQTKAKILVVDDSEFNRMTLKTILGDDFELLEATIGKECMEILKEQGFGISLILLDIIMPESDGFEVLQFMEEEKWMGIIPVIMISSEGSNDVIKKAYEYGVIDYIEKPFDARIVYQRILNTIKLYTKQRRLMSIVSDKVYSSKNEE